MTGVSRDYTGRSVDLEVMQTVQVPQGQVGLSLTAVDGVTRRVTGMQKAVQRYVTLLLTPSDSVPFPYYDGNELFSALQAGSVSDAGYLRHLFNTASAVAIDTIKRDDYNTDSFGDIPDDERIESVTLDGVTVDYETSTLGLSLVFRTEAGSDYAYVVPVSTRRR